MYLDKQIWLARLAIVVWWVFFAAIAFSLNSISYMANGKAFPTKHHVVWHIGWLIWCGLSFLAIYLARRFPFERQRLRRNLLIHFGLGILVVLIHVGIESLLVIWLRTQLGLDPLNNKIIVGSLFGYKFHINLLIYWATVGITYAHDYYVKFRKSEVVSSQLEAKLAQSELQALKMQLHPHFLFNTHHSIISLMLKQKNDEAIKMLTQLSDLLRITLEKTKQQLSSLKEELDTLDLYLGIQKVRFKDRLDIEISAESDVFDAEVPYLLLQPLVENALKHGIESKTTGGRIEIAAKKSGMYLELSVRDNGPGLGYGNGNRAGNGIGLKTTRSRLNQLYGDQQSMWIDSSGEGGTSVNIKIPFKATTSA